MHIVIIGATGNVGTALLRRLHAADEVTSIAGVSRNGPDRTGEPYENVRWHRLDIGEAASAPALVEAMRGADAVVHLAWVIRPNRDNVTLRRINVNGSRRVFEAAAAAGVPHLVYASSVGAYGRPDRVAPGPGPQDESFPTCGAPASHYGRQKAEVEAILDEVSTSHPEMLVTRLRPGLIFQEEAGPEIRDYFLGALAPRSLLRAVARMRVPLVPWPRGVVTQAVHTDDVADAYWRVIQQHAGGAFNVAADPPLSPDTLGTVLGARRWLPVPVPLVRALVSAAYRLRLEPTDPGWVDMAVLTPVMSTERIRSVVGWEPSRSTHEALRAVIDHLGDTGGLGNSRHRSRSPLR